MNGTILFFKNFTRFNLIYYYFLLNYLIFIFIKIVKTAINNNVFNK